MKITNTETFILRAKEIHNNKYDYSLANYNKSSEKVEIICPEHGIFKQMPRNHVHLKQGCPSCSGNKKSNRKNFIKKSVEIHGNKYDYSLTNYTGAKNKVKIICPKHGIFEQVACNHIEAGNESGCPSCNESRGEKEISQWLNSNRIKYEKQKQWKECRYKRPLPFDFYLPEYNTCIEYDGIQHFIPRWGGQAEFESLKTRDSIKNKYCKNNNIQLIRIKYDENIKNKLKEIICE